MQGARWIQARRPLQYVEHPSRAQRSRYAASRLRSSRLVEMRVNPEWSLNATSVTRAVG
jgi:hypothetical protein